MLTKDSIEKIMRERNQRGNNIIRDIQIVQSYFGLGVQPTPTLQSLADEFGGMTRERIRQIVERKFVQKVQEEDKDSVYEIERVIRNFPKIWFDDLKGILEERELADSGLHNHGLYNMFELFKICLEYEVYTLDFDNPTPTDFKVNAPTFLVRRNEKDNLFKELLVIRGVLGVHGIACLEKVVKQEKLDKSNIPFFRSLLTHSKEYWTHENQEGLWYLLEDRDSVLLNVLEKVAFVTRRVPIEILSAVVQQYINRRTLQYGPPSQEIITIYLEESPKTIYENDEITILVDEKILNNIEQDILQFYQEREEINLTYSELSNYLEALGYQKPNYNKALFHSPILYIDRSEGRGNYRFVVIDALSSKNLYEKTMKRLKSLEGTDFSEEVQLRTEQHIFREWLFLGKNTEYCAVCGKLYSVHNMVCAHKKKRAYCTEDERTDPFIVMPLCLFGCDTMYEHEYFEIEDGKVIVHIENLMETEKKYANLIIGRKIDTRWLKGNPNYFKRNYKIEEQ